MTLLTLSMPWPTLIIIFPLCLGLFNIMASMVHLGMMESDDGREWGTVFFSPAPAGIIWLYATAATGMILSPAPVQERLLALFFSLFLFRMTLTDAMTGLLPRDMTVSCLFAGMSAALISPCFTAHLLSSAASLCIFGGWRYVTFKLQDRECLGLGDVWLAGAISAWLGGHEGLYALLTGVALFVLWQLSVRRISEGGPMGPWLSGGAILIVLINLYKPLMTW